MIGNTSRERAKECKTEGACQRREHDPKVDGAQRKKVGAHAFEMEHQEGKKQRHGDDDGHDDGGPPVGHE